MSGPFSPVFGGGSEVAEGAPFATKEQAVGGVAPDVKMSPVRTMDFWNVHALPLATALIRTQEMVATEHAFGE